MTDFLAELEAELLAAARRRAAAPRGRRVRPAAAGAVRRLALAAAAAVVVVAVAGGLLALLRRDDTAAPPERPVAPALRGAVVTPRAWAPAAYCAHPSAPREIATPAGLRSRLAVLRRPQQEPDGLPTLNAQPPAAAGDLSWLPLDAWAPRGTRLASDGNTIHLVPGAGTGAHGCARPRISRRAPARLCVVSGPPGGPLDVACFDTAEVLGGRALVRIGPGTVAGVLPDGVAGVRLDTGHGTVVAKPFRNVFLAHVPAAAAGGPLGVTLEGPHRLR